MPTVVSKNQYFDTALDVLASSGFQGLNIRRMCTALGVTTGSFYHHFGNLKGFRIALLDYWELRQEVILRELKFGEGTAEGDLLALRTLTLGLPHAAETAIRAWGMNDPIVHDVQRRVDAARQKTVRAAVLRIVGSEDVADVLATLGMSTLVGYQHLRADGDQSDLGTLLDSFFRIVYLHRDHSLVA